MLCCWVPPWSHGPIAEPDLPLPIRGVTVSDLFVPAKAGQVVVRQPASRDTPARRTVIIIQDAHVNYEAQKHIADVIAYLATTYGIQLVLVEGGTGDASLSYLRQYATPEQRQEVAERHLRKGEISGDEYLDLIADYPLTLWGIESPALYDENLRVFLSTESIREATLPAVRHLRAALTVAKAARYPEALRALEQAAADYQSKSLSLKAYVEQLDGWLKQAALPAADYPRIQAFLRTSEQEQSLDLGFIQQEQQRALQALEPGLAPEGWQRIVAAGKEVQAGTRSQASYYIGLEEALLELPGGLNPYPRLTAYVHYLRTAEEILPAELTRELRQLAWALRARLAQTPEARRLVEIDQGLELLRRLLALDLTPDEHKALTAQLEQTADWPSAWAEVLTREGVPEALIATLPQIAQAVPEAATFYAVAAKRDIEIANRIVAKLSEDQARAAILRIGGYHVPQVAKLLGERGIDVAVVTPKVTQETDEANYARMLKVKSGLAIDTAQGDREETR